MGRTIPADDEVGRVKIPFTSILTSLAVLIVPILIGLLIKYKLPRVSKFIKRGLKVRSLTSTVQNISLSRV